MLVPNVHLVIIALLSVGSLHCRQVCDVGNRKNSSCLKTNQNVDVPSVIGGNQAAEFVQVEGDSFGIRYPQMKPAKNPETTVEFTCPELESWVAFPFKMQTNQREREVLKRNVLLFSMSERFYPELRLYRSEPDTKGERLKWTRMNPARDKIAEPLGPNKAPADKGERYFELDNETDYLAVVGTRKDKNLKSATKINDAHFLIWFTSDTTQIWSSINGFWFNGLDREKPHHANDWAIYDFNTKNKGDARIISGRQKYNNGTFNPTLLYINPDTRSLRFYFTHGYAGHCQSTNGRRSSLEFIPNQKNERDQLHGSSNFPEDCLINVRMQNNTFKDLVEKVLSSAHK